MLSLVAPAPRDTDFSPYLPLNQFVQTMFSIKKTDTFSTWLLGSFLGGWSEARAARGSNRRRVCA